MTLAEQIQAIRASLRTALEARWPATADRAAPEVRIGDRWLGEHVGPARVVLCYATADERAPRELGTNPRTIAERVWDVEAHVWVSEYSASLTDDEIDIARVSDLETILDDLSRAVYENTHGSIGGGTPRDSTITVVRDTEVLRFGEAAVALFAIGAPVIEGPTLEAVDDIASAIEGDGVTVVVNESWGA
jgi:hypothetical protein